MVRKKKNKVKNVKRKITKLVESLKKKTKAVIKKRSKPLKEKSVKKVKKVSLPKPVIAKIKFKPDEEIKRVITEAKIETPVKEMQYYPKEPFQPVYEPKPQELPKGYNDNKIVAMSRDPWWIHVYWEITKEKLDLVRQNLGNKIDNSRCILRVYDVTSINFNGRNANSFFDIDITLGASNWYINVSRSDRFYCIDIGILTAEGEFIMLARSNVVSTPRETPSWITDEEWMILPSDFEKLYALSGGLKLGASPVGLKKLAKERLKMHLASGAISSLASPVRRQLPRERGFWLSVNTELIVYGATEPDAKVIVRNRPIKLNKDGSFSLRFALPEGRQAIPVKATSNDEKDSRTITPVVSKHTE